MFVIKPASQYDWVHALFILSHYHVMATMYSDAEHIDSVFMVVSEHPEHVGTDDERMAEMAFQMNWHQKGNICPVCEVEKITDPEHECKIWDTCGHDCEDCDITIENTCGHLTFVKPIVPAF